MPFARLLLPLRRLPAALLALSLAACVGNVSGAPVERMLAGRTVIFGEPGSTKDDSFWQDWSADGTTRTGGPSVFHDKTGRWKVENGTYCEIFGASTEWNLLAHHAFGPWPPDPVLGDSGGCGRPADLPQGHGGVLRRLRPPLSRPSDGRCQSPARRSAAARGGPGRARAGRSSDGRRTSRERPQRGQSRTSAAASAPAMSAGRRSVSAQWWNRPRRTG